MATGNPIKYSDIISEDVQKRLDDLTATIEALTNEMSDLNKETKKEDSTAASYNDTLRDQVEITDDLLRLLQEENALRKDVEKAQKSYDQAVKDGLPQQDKFQMAVAKGKENLRALGFELKNSIKINNAVKGSMTELSLELGKNRMAYRKLSEAQRNNDKIGGRLLRTIQKQDKAIKKLDSQIGNHQRNVGNYNSALDGLSSTLGGFGLNLRVVANSFRTYSSLMKLSSTAMAGMGKSAKALRIALISTGIGAIVVALGSLVAALSQSNKFTGWWADKLAILKGAFNGVLETAGKLGDALYYLFSGDFSKAWDTATEAVSEYDDEIIKAIAHERELLKLRKEQAEATRFSSTYMNSLRQASERLQKVWKDDNVAMEERNTAWNEWHEIQLKIADKQIEIAEAELALAASIGNSTDATEEDKKAWDEAIVVWQNAVNVRNDIQDDEFINYMNFETQAVNNLKSAYEQLVEMINKENAAEERLANDRKRRQKAYIKAIGEEFEYTEDYIDDGLNELTDAYFATGDAAEFTSQQAMGAVSQASGILSGLAKENKDLQLSTALINTFAGVAMALASAPPPGNFISAALVLAAGLANVSQMQNTSVPSYEKGTDYLTGDNDEININAHRGERIVPTQINNQLLGIPNIELPKMVHMGQMFQGGLLSIARQQLQSQRDMARTMKQFAYVDSKGQIHYLDGSLKNYV